MARLGGLLTASQHHHHQQQQSHHHQHHHPHQQVQYRTPAPPPQLPGFNYSNAAATGGGGGGVGTVVAQHHVPPIMVRCGPPQVAAQQHTLLHHRPVYSNPSNNPQPPPPPPPPPPYSNSPDQLNNAGASPSYLVSGDSSLLLQGTQYRVAPVSAAGGIAGRQVLVRPPPPQALQQQQLLPQNASAASPPIASSMANVVQNSPLLVGLLQQPDQQQVKSPGPSVPSPELGLASTHLTSLAANHFSATVHHHRPLVNNSVINQYSSTTRSKDGLTTHQQVYSGGSVITNARVPVPGGLQQHPQATGKPPPMIGGNPQGLQQGAAAATLPVSTAMPRNGPVVLQQSHHAPQQVVHSTASSVMHQAPVLPTRSLVHAAAAASPSPTISPTPSLPSPHTSIPSSVVSQTSGLTSSFVGNHVTALTPPLTPSNQQMLSINSSVSAAHNISTTSACSISTTASDALQTSQTDAALNSIFSQANIVMGYEGKAKVPSPKSIGSGGSKESQYLINPNTGLLEPRHNTDSSDSESESPPQKLPLHHLQTQGKGTTTVLKQQQQCDPLTQAVSTAKSVDQGQTRLFSASNSCEDMKSSCTPRGSVASASALVSSALEGAACDSITSTANSREYQEISRVLPSSALVQDRTKAKDEASSTTDDKSVRSFVPGEMKVKIKIGRESVSQKTISANANKKSDKKDMVLSGGSSSSPSLNEQRVVPKLHIKFGSSPHVIVKPVPDDKDRNRKISDKSKDDRKRKGNRKRPRNSDCESDKIDLMKMKSRENCQDSNVLKLGDLKKAKLDHDSEEGGSYRSKESGDGRSKGPRTFEDKFSNKVDNLKLAKFDAKLRTRPKIKTPIRKLGSINNLGELTSHKILETLPPSITKVAALHTQQPHRNPTSSSSSSGSCSSGSYFNKSDSSSSHHRLDSEVPSDKEDPPCRRTTALMNGDLSHAQREALSRSIQSNTFSELTAGGKLTIKRKAPEHVRSTSSLNLLKKPGQNSDSNKRKIGEYGYNTNYMINALLFASFNNILLMSL